MSSPFCNTTSFTTRSVRLILSTLLQQNVSKFPGTSDISSQVYKFQHLHTALLQLQHSTSFLHTLKSNLLVRRAFFMLNAASAKEILDLISQVNPASFVILLHKQKTVHSFRLFCIYQSVLETVLTLHTPFTIINCINISLFVAYICY